MNIHTAFPTKYISAKDLPHPVHVVIQSLEMETIKGDDGDKVLPTLYFRGKEKGLVLNQTNAGTIAEMYGDETDDWIDKQIVLFPTKTAFGRKMVPCVRIREPQAVAPPAPAPARVPDEAINTPDDDIPF